MNEIEFDQALSKFLDDSECERVNQALFDLVRDAFTAGWKAALGSDIAKFMQIEKRREQGFVKFQNEAYQKLGVDCPL